MVLRSTKSKQIKLYYHMQWTVHIGYKMRGW